MKTNNNNFKTIIIISKNYIKEKEKIKLSLQKKMERKKKEIEIARIKNSKNKHRIFKPNSQFRE